MLSWKLQISKNSWLQKSIKKRDFEKTKKKKIYWNKYENFSLDFTSKESDSNNSISNQASFDKNKVEIKKRYL